MRRTAQYAEKEKNEVGVNLDHDLFHGTERNGLRLSQLSIHYKQKILTGVDVPSSTTRRVLSAASRR